jgi:hypothetical protein
MKISSLLETITPASAPNQEGSQAPKFGRHPDILEDDENLEETTSGSVATGSPTNLGVQRRGQGSIFQGVKTSGKFPNSKAVKENLKDTSLQTLQKAKQNIQQNTQDDVAAWEKDFKQNFASRFKKPEQPQQATTQPTEPQVQEPQQQLTYPEIKARLAKLQQVIEKQKTLDQLILKAEKQGLMHSALRSDVDTKLYMQNAEKDNYETLNDKLDSSIQKLQDRINTHKLAYSKPKVMREEDLSEEQLLADKLKKELALFKKGKDNELSSRPKDHDLGEKPKDKELQKGKK